MNRAMFVLALLLGIPAPSAAQTPVKVGFCARTLSSAVAPFAIATKLGWYERGGIRVQLVPVPGSTETIAAAGSSW